MFSVPPCGAQRIPNPEQSIKKTLMSLLLLFSFSIFTPTDAHQVSTLMKTQVSGDKNITRSAHTEPTSWSYRSSLTVWGVRRETHNETRSIRFCVCHWCFIELNLHLALVLYMFLKKYWLVSYKLIQEQDSRNLNLIWSLNKRLFLLCCFSQVYSNLSNISNNIYVFRKV